MRFSFHLFLVFSFRAQGNVYKGIERITGREVAIKVIQTEDAGADLEREIELLVKMRSPFIISFIEAMRFEEEIWVTVSHIDFVHSSIRL
jgi:serine/threonine protein kinase